MLRARFRHINLVARNWERLAEFYEQVFGCVRVPPERHLAGGWLARGTGVAAAAFSGVHLRLPGCGEDGPTLEIYHYAVSEGKPEPAANREGFAHIAFQVEDVEEALAEVRRHGGGEVGEVVSHKVEGAGTLTFVYVTDPEGNILELQHWA